MFGEPTGAKVCSLRHCCSFTLVFCGSVTVSISHPQVLAPSDIADAVVYAATRPEHVAVNEVMVEPREEPC